MEEMQIRILKPFQLPGSQIGIPFTRSIKNELALTARFLWNVNEEIEPSTRQRRVRIRVYDGNGSRLRKLRLAGFTMQSRDDRLCDIFILLKQMTLNAGQYRSGQSL